MPWLVVILSILGGVAVAGLVCLVVILLLKDREPYASFLRLSTRRKLSFFRLLIQDNRVPFQLKLLLVAALVYFISPVDFLPGIVVDDVAFALVALVIVIKFMPPQALQHLLEQAGGSDSAGTSPTDGVGTSAE